MRGDRSKFCKRPLDREDNGSCLQRLLLMTPAPDGLLMDSLYPLSITYFEMCPLLPIQKDYKKG